MIEILNSLLYESKKLVLALFKVISGIATVSAFCLIIYENGFFLDVKTSLQIHGWQDVIFGVYAVNYLVKWLYSFERIKYIHTNWFEGAVVFFIVISEINTYLFDYHFIEEAFKLVHVDHYYTYYRVFITLLMLYLIGHKFVKASNYIHTLALKPATTFILSFVFLILIGAGMLMLPAMTTNRQGATFLEALFTSVSASCVTGLIVVDTATFYSTKGQYIIIFLMQLGGIGIVSFATFFATFMKKGVGIKHQVVIQDFMNTESLSSAKGLLRQVVIITSLIEVTSIILIFFSWGDQIHFRGLGQKIFYSVFHGISAFCNAGFSLFSNGLYEDVVRQSYLLHIIIACTIFMGSLGFSVITDIFSPKMLRERLEKPWKDWKLSTKISLFTSIVLVIMGMLLFYLIEKDNPATIKDLSAFEQFVASFFQSMTTRTAGFNTLDFGAFKVPTLIFMIFLMFIGASSGSTGGGIKTSTFLLITSSSWATIRGRKTVSIGRRSISNELLFKAYSVFVFAATFCLFMIFLLSITEEGKDVIDVVFEEISAFATVGLSTGITASLSVAGKWIIIVSMFVGRIGTLTLALAISSRVMSNSYTYPHAHIMIG